MKHICGVDEVGRGPLAGPVVAAAVVFREDYLNPEIKDSKKLSAKKREYLCDIICQHALGFAVVSVGHHRIGKLNILWASVLAMSLAVKRVSQKTTIDKVLVDGNQRIDCQFEQETIVGGDNLCVSISAASILAKVKRDQLMSTLDIKYPGYFLAKHAGYPTLTHRQALKALGPCPIHRRGFNLGIGPTS